MPSWASISSKPRFTSSRASLCETNGSTSMSPASQRSTNWGTWSRPLQPPKDEPATRRPVIRKRGTMSTVSPFPATPQIVARPQPIRADSTAWRMTATLPVASKGVVGAQAVRHLHDLLDGVRPANERVGRALAARQFQPLVGEVDADDPLGALQSATRDRAETDHAGAEDDAGRAGLHPRGVDRRAEARRQAAGEEAGAVERRLLAHVRERDLGHDGVFRKSRAAHEVPDRLPVPREPRGSVR